MFLLRTAHDHVIFYHCTDFLWMVVNLFFHSMNVKMYLKCPSSIMDEDSHVLMYVSTWMFLKHMQNSERGSDDFKDSPTDFLPALIFSAQMRWRQTALSVWSGVPVGYSVLNEQEQNPTAIDRPVFGFSSSGCPSGWCIQRHSVPVCLFWLSSAVILMSSPDSLFPWVSSFVKILNCNLE